MIKDTSVLTIDVGGNCLKVAEFFVGENNDSIALVKYAIKEFPQELAEANFAEAFRQTFSEILQENEFSSTQVRVAISSLHAFQRLSKLPPLLGNSAKAAAIVEGEAKLTVPYPLDEVLWDYQLIKHTKVFEVEAEATEDQEAPAEKITETVEELEALFVAVKEDLAGEIASVLLDADFEVLSIEVSPTAIYNAARANMYGEEYCDMILDLGGRGSNLIILDGNRLFIRAIPIGGNTITQQIAKEFSIGFEDAEEMKRKHGFVALGGAYEDSDSEVAATISKIARNVMTRLHGEINRSINAWRSMHSGNRPQRLFISGGSSIIPYVPHFLTEKLRLEVNFLNTFPVINIAESVDKQALQESAHLFPPMIGMAIRHVRTCPVEIALVPKVIQAARDLARRKPYFYLSAACALLLLLVFYGGVSANSFFHKRLTENNAHTLQEAQQAKQMLRGAKNTLDEHKGIYEALRDAARNRNRWTKILNELQNCTPKHMWFTQIDGVTAFEDPSAEQQSAPPADDMGMDAPPEDPMMEESSGPSAPPQEVKWLRLKGHSLVMTDDNSKAVEDIFLGNLLEASKKEDGVFNVRKEENRTNGYKIPALTLGSGNDNVTSFVIYVELKNSIQQ